MIWQAIKENEVPGKPLRECRFKRIRLTVLCIEEDLEVLRNHGHSAKRGQQILGMTQEAVVRYANDFKRVRECLKEGWNIEPISYTIGLSKSLTKEYVDMLNEKEILF